MLAGDFSQTLQSRLLDCLPDKREGFAIAYSGGGDSTAIVHALRELRPRIFIVDHALRTESRKEAEAAKQLAKSLDMQAEILTWRNDSPKTGLQEKARKARYGLLGAACRKAGIQYLVTGHTESDQAETLLMRYDRNTDWRGAAGMREKAVAPLWPELAGVTLLRPALTFSRQDMRDYNESMRLKWVDDLSNENNNFARVLARKKLVKQPGLASLLLSTARDLARGRDAEIARLAEIAKQRTEYDRFGIIRIEGRVPDKLLEYFLRAASGTGGPVSATRLKVINDRLGRPDFKALTYLGAMIVKNGNEYLIMRDPVAVKGRDGVSALKAQGLNVDEPSLWDGRFWITASLIGITVRPLYGHQSRLSDAQRAKLKLVHTQARPSLPLVLKGQEIIAVGEDTYGANVKVKCAVGPRLDAQFTPG